MTTPTDGKRDDYLDGVMRLDEIVRSRSDKEIIEIVTKLVGDMLSIMQPGDHFKIERCSREGAEPMFKLYLPRDSGTAWYD